MSRIIEVKVLEEIVLNTIKTLEKKYMKLPFDNIEDWEEKWRLDERIYTLKELIGIIPEIEKRREERME
ncbi:hypothetical protein OAV50_00040 [Flavobacteriaceae bacterium]|nr:hypothetical protein [Flavobacteriaceae bacterium]